MSHVELTTAGSLCKFFQKLNQARCLDSDFFDLSNRGSLFGTTGTGGTNSHGAVFQICTNGGLITLYSFPGGDDGEIPNGVVQGTDGYFYSTTYDGGFGYGTVFRLTIVAESRVGRSYQIQASPDMNSWNTVSTIHLNSNPYLWIDQNAVIGNKFYRAVLLP
jgi:uncharacterized repeat protein (TIGR03803 family)